MTYVFEDIEKLARLVCILYNRDEISSLRVDKTIYFLYAYYGAKIIEQNLLKEMPKDLINITFEINKMGYDIKEYDKPKTYYYNETRGTLKGLNLTEKEEACVPLFKEIIDQLNETGDFTLVELQHSFEVFKKGYEDGTLFKKEDLYQECLSNLKY